MKLAICDDDIYIHNQIRSFLKNTNFSDEQYNIIDFYSGEELLNSYSSGEKADIIFLDVEMNKVNGIEVAEEIRKTDEEAIIIFVSSHKDYVYDCFRVEALHYIVKPIDEFEFSNVLTRAISKYNRINSIIPLQWNNDFYRIKIEEIVYVEGYKRHLFVHTTKDKIQVIGKISDIFHVLEPHGFIQVHQGFIVNMNYINKFEKYNVVLYNDEKIMISVRKRTEALKKFSQYLKKWKW